MNVAEIEQLAKIVKDHNLRSLRVDKDSVWLEGADSQMLMRQPADVGLTAEQFRILSEASKTSDEEILHNPMAGLEGLNNG